MAEVTTRPDRATRQAETIIGDEYERFKDEVLRTVGGKLAVSHIRFSPLDLAAFYNQAWYGLYTKLTAGDEIHNRLGLLVTMTHRRAVDEYRSISRAELADVGGDLDGLVEDTVAERLDDRTQLRHFIEGMRSNLSERELQAATLCYLYGYSRPEAAEQVGVRPKRMEKIMDVVSKKLGPVMAQIKDGDWCQSRREEINLFALGALDESDPRYAEVVDHLHSCSGCRAYVRGARSLTSVAPPALFLFAAFAGAGAAAEAAAAAASGGGSGSSSAAAGSGGHGVATGAAHGSAALVKAAAIAATVSVVAVSGAVFTGAINGRDQSSTYRGAATTSNVDLAARQAAAAKRRAEKHLAAQRRAAARRAAARRQQAAPPQAAAATPAPLPAAPKQATPHATPSPPKPKAKPAPKPPKKSPSGNAGDEFDLQ